MGVTLERVQFKFASIIGELCSEPKILSQFAVWLDMRLAEFKLKGSISLDYSGEPVPPEWMQGMGEVMAANAVHKGKSESAAPQSTDYVKHDDDIIIEDSQMSDSIHTAESFQSNCTRTTDMSRKRANIQWQEDQFKYTPKSARYLADDTDTERNQSLMSIITETADSETSFQNPLSNDVSSFNMTDAGSTKDFQEGSKLSQYSYPTQSSDQSTSGTQLNSNISVYHQDSKSETETERQGYLSGAEFYRIRRRMSHTVRGKYYTYTASQRAEIAKYAIMIGVKKASIHFSEKYQKYVQPSTIVSIKQQCLKYMKDNNCEIQDITELPRIINSSKKKL